jgi:hypothetical protein
MLDRAATAALVSRARATAIRIETPSSSGASARLTFSIIREMAW